ncbi:unnamed protein product [Prunus armeniaca]|uniref:Uncharacterized protein n=1 Tax=Prunus armeniaca TaxID=36596 RepID=A0A6J5VI55_PRUAR|nr:hypothetical protein GBA52_022470 [Prunus armeniaca]CAB4288640.1 unnamed protein product [Prunus armeniaca]
MDCSRLMGPFAYDIGFHGLVSSTENSSSADLSFPESIFSDSVSEESISANSSSEYSLLLSLKNSILELMVGLSRNT